MITLSQMQPDFGRSPRCRHSSARRLCWLLVCVLSVLTLAQVTSAEDQRPAHRQFRVSFAKSLRAEPFSGRVVLYFSQTRPQPRERLDWFHPEVLVGRDVADWKPDEPLL